MKTLVALLILTNLWYMPYFSRAQAPQGINYQAIARDAHGEVLDNQAIRVKIALREGSATGAALYKEIYQLTTNPFGLFHLVIGQGTSLTGRFDAITWGSATKFLQISIDPEGGDNFIDMGTTQLLSVPFALYAEKSGNVNGQKTFRAGKGLMVSGDTITNTGDTDASDDLTIASEANGDVGGNFSALKVEKLQGTKLQMPDSISKGAVLKWDGAQWKPRMDSMGQSFWTAHANDLIYQQGNIGIGTEAPQEKIHLHDTTGNENALLFTNHTVIDTTRASGFVIGMDDRDGYLNNRENGYITFSTNNRTAMVISSSGSVHISKGASISNGLDVYQGLKAGVLTADNDEVLISGSDNNGSTAPLHIRSNTQHMLIDGNEIDSNVDLFVNHNNSNDVYMVTGGGRVGIGTFNPRSYLHVVHDAADWGGNSGFRLENRKSHYAWVFYTDEEGNLNLYAKDARFNATAFMGRFDPGSGAYQKRSDARLKKNITPLGNVLSQVMELNATSYQYVDHPDTAQRSLGFMAQEVQPLFPELVGHGGGEDFMSLDYDGFGVLAIKAIQEQQTIIEQLRQRIEVLEQQLKPEK